MPSPSEPQRPKPPRRNTGGRRRPTKAAPPSTGPAADPHQRLAALVAHAARDIGQVATAFDAELLLSTLLGSVYAAAPPDRAQAQESLVTALRTQLAGEAPAGVDVLGSVLAALTGQPVPADPAGQARGPAWLAELGRVRVTGGYAYGDRYGDQTTYLVAYAYQDPVLGGPDHAVVVLVDHNLGVAKDLFVASPASTVLDQLRASVGTDGDAMTWFAEVGPSTVAAAAMAYLRGTDTAADLPDEESLPANRALVLARLNGLPAAPEPALGPVPTPAAGTAPAPETADGDRTSLVGEFLGSPDAQLAGLADLTGARRESLTYCLGLLVDFGLKRGGDPLRWSPRSVELFLLDWVHQRAVLDADDGQLLPDVLGAWVSWSGRRVDLPIPAINETITAVRRLRTEFARLCATGERRSPASQAMAQLLADGVDPSDQAALDAWIRDHLS